MERTRRRSGVVQALGPGIMYAGAAIGVSHLVQSTRAGAGYGFALIWAVIVAHLLKYPFFEFSHRYAAATGDSLLVGYRRVGRWALIGFLLVAFALSLPTIAVLTIVTAGMASQMIAVGFTSMTWAIILLIGCLIVLACGGYPLLDGLMKVLMVFLAVCTVLAVGAALVVRASEGHASMAALESTWPGMLDVTGILFVVTLMGWMPTPVDASVWPSLWMQERTKQTGHRPTLYEALFDFRLGYAASFIMAMMFLVLGALVMFDRSETFAGSAPDFAAQFVAMYTDTLGGWSRPVIVTAAFIAMLSTMLTVLDGYPRVMTVGCRLAWPVTEKLGTKPYWVFIIIMMVGALLIYRFLTSHMRTLVDLATTLAFVSAPLFAYLNHHVIFTADLPEEAVPPPRLRVLSWVGLVFLTGFSILFLVVRFGYSTNQT